MLLCVRDDATHGSNCSPPLGSQVWFMGSYIACWYCFQVCFISLFFFFFLLGHVNGCGCISCTLSIFPTVTSAGTVATGIVTPVDYVSHVSSNSLIHIVIMRAHTLNPSSGSFFLLPVPDAHGDERVKWSSCHLYHTYDYSNHSMQNNRRWSSYLFYDMV